MQNTSKKVKQLFGLLVLAGILSSAQAESMDADILTLQQEWDKINYKLLDKSAKLQAIHTLEEKAAAISKNYPDRAEPKIWQGIILSTDAGIVKSMSALGKVKQAKALFEKAIATDPNALDGSAQASLGVLYYQVPGWPISFGNDKKAEKYLQTALKINPNGIDSNYFYGDFLVRQQHFEEAIPYLQTAMKAPNRPNRPVADAGRRQEISQALKKAQSGKVASN